MGWPHRRHTVTVVNRIFESVPVQERGLDAALAVLRLSRRYSAARVEAACTIALATLRSPRYAHLQPILETGQDQPRQDRAGGRIPRFEVDPESEPVGNVRGGDYYAGGAR